MKLYYSPGACSLAVRIIIHELGAACEFESVNLKTKQTEKGQDFLAINPKGAVPALLIDQQLLTENTVILQYLAEHYSGHSVLPEAASFEHYRVLEALNFVSTDVHKTAGALFNDHIPNEVKETVFVPLLKNKLHYIEQHLLTQKPYLVGDQFSLADAYLFAVLRWMGYFKIDIAEYTHLSTYFKKLAKRPSIEKSLQEEGLS